MVASRRSVFIATSLDGFIAREQGSIDWLLAADVREPGGEDYGYGEFIAAVDAIVMGRKSFEKVVATGEWPYGDKPVVVLSRFMTELPDWLPDTVSLANQAPAELVDRLAARRFHHLYVDGGDTIQRFLAAGLLDELTITTIPILIGTGRPLFGPLADGDVHLELLASRSWPNGFVQSRYRVNRPDRFQDGRGTRG